MDSILANLLSKHDKKTCSPILPLVEASCYLTDDSRIVIYNVLQYKRIIGALQYVTLTRLEITFSVNKLSQLLLAPSDELWQACKRLLRSIKETIHYGILFYYYGNMRDNYFNNFDWACYKDDRKSVVGYV